MKRILEKIDNIVEKYSNILLPIFFISFFAFGIFSTFTKEKSLVEALIEIFLFLKNNMILIIISIIFSIIIVLVLTNIRRNKSKVFFPKLNILNIFIPITIWVALIIINQDQFYPFLLLIPLIISIFIIQGFTEYYKISGETLFVYKGLLSGIRKKYNINEIKKIGFGHDSSGEGTETFIRILFIDNNFVDLREKIENRNYFFNQLLAINNNIYIDVYDQIKVSEGTIITGNVIYDKLLNEEKNNIFLRIIYILFLIFLYTVDFYIIIKIILNMWHFA